ncbi:hypothetical protein A4X09_0g3913 [Tilletia walkeri]|uniref:Mitochondrial outer membrane transport complex Sam37/metaxin N-terminal domain-containing protein n=1 Tax=Tilletia walkeri TaxID=117179 RepID=A0A8X7N8E5_9BASI|nr:hypothetical protein A4X09_0g3913 [Tilletia walkeri]
MPTLFIWGALDPTPAAQELAGEKEAGTTDYSQGQFALPTLDPSSLYAASLLRLIPSSASYNTQHTLTLATPSPLLHGTVPRLEFGAENDGHSHSLAARTDALQGIQPIETYARTPSAAQQRHSIDDAFRTNALSAARATALHSVITHELEPLILHALFSHQENFRNLAVPTYTYTPGQKTPTSLPAKVGSVLAAPVHIRPRLRTSVQAQLSRRGIWGLAGSAEEEREKEQRAKKGRRLGKDAGEQDGPSRVRLGENGKKAGFKGSNRKEMAIGWERAKLTSITKQCLDVLNSALDQDPSKTSWLLDASIPTSLDAHLFSVMAPVLFPGALSATNLETTTPIPSLLRTQYPALVAHATRLAQLLWAVQPVTVEGPSGYESHWEWQPSATQAVHVAHRSASSSASSSVSLTSAASYLASSVLSAPSNAWSSVRSYLTPRRSARPQSTSSSSDSPSFLRPESLGWGRIIWIGSAVVGFVSFIFVAGIIQVEFVEEGAVQDEDEDEATDGEEGSENENDGDERQVDGEEILMEEGEGEPHEFEEEEEEEGDAEELINSMYMGDDDDD